MAMMMWRIAQASVLSGLWRRRSSLRDSAGGRAAPESSSLGESIGPTSVCRPW